MWNILPFALKRSAKKSALIIIMLSFGFFLREMDAEALFGRSSSLESSRIIAIAIAAGDSESLKSILKRNPSAVKSRDRDQRTPLHYCADRPIIPSEDNSHIDQDQRNWEAQCKSMADILLAYGADVNARDAFSMSPLHYAARSGNIEVAKVLLNHKADVNARENYNSTPLHIAAWNGNTEFARLLIGKGANVNAQDKFGSPLIAAIEEHRDMVELLLKSKADVRIKNPDGFAPIHLSGNKDISQLLFAYGAKLDTVGYQGRTPLHQAAMRHRNDILEWLCMKGAQVNAIDSDSLTPLMSAISQHGNTEVARRESMKTIRILLRYGADVNYRNRDGRTILHDAVGDGREDLVDILLKYGASINAKDKYGYTPLHWSVSSKNKKMVELLVNRGADVNARNLQGHTPLYDTWGGSKVDVEIANILKSHGGIQ